MHVALVDPSRTVLKYVTGLLQARRHEVTPFTDGYDALEFLHENQTVSAVITSAELGAMAGVDLCAKARSLASNRRPLYIILMSSNDDRNYLIKALDSGADDFMGKPPVPEELYARLRAAERLITTQNDLLRLATTDSLTGLLNRRAFFEKAELSLARARIGRPLGAILCDIDHFKRINDRYGHAVGDAALRAVTSVIAEAATNAGRLGGEEFAVLIEDAGLERAVAIAEDLRQGVEKRRFAANGETLSLTCSFGVSEWRPCDSIDELLRRADAALYAAKSGGRNRVVAADSILPTQGTGSGAVRRADRAAGDEPGRDRRNLEPRLVC
jgi:two-component system cell cycle response regulator